MDRKDNDPDYRLHEFKRPTRKRDGPRTDASGQEDRGDRREGSAQEVQRRRHMDLPDPAELREEQRRRGSPNAVPEDDETP